MMRVPGLSLPARYIFIVSLILGVVGKPANFSPDESTQSTSSDLSTMLPLTEEGNGTDRTPDKRAVGRAMHWLNTREDSIHAPNSTLAGDDWHASVPWGQRRRADRVQMLPSIPNKLPGIPHIEDPAWLKKLFG